MTMKAKDWSDVLKQAQSDDEVRDILAEWAADKREEDRDLLMFEKYGDPSEDV